MKTRAKLLLPLLFAVILNCWSQTPGAAASRPMRIPSGPVAFQRLVDQYWTNHYSHNPSEATAAGFHEHDPRLEDYSSAGVQREVRDLRLFLRQFERFPVRGLDRIAAVDREIAITLIRSQLHELENIRMWEKDPDLYSSGPSNSIFVIMARNYATLDARLRSAIARLRQIPGVFKAARTNLKNPPKIYTQVALEQLPGIVSFFQSDVPKAFEAVKDEALLAEFRTANRKVIEELKAYQKFLEDDLLPRSNGDFRIGAENFSKKLLYEEMVGTPLDELRRIGLEDLRRNQQRFRETAAKINPSRPAREVQAELAKDHPDSGVQLLQSFRDVLDGLRTFLVDKHIVSVPSPLPPRVEETPPFARALTFASMDTPGAFETSATEAFFNVTLPAAGDSPQEAEELLSAYDRGSIISTAIHEVYPGHYLQYLWAVKAPSKFRKLLWSSSGFGSNAEGWAHYTEQMMLDEGYGNGDPKLRLGQLQDALLRNARFLVGIEMHTGNMTYDQGIEFFMKEAFMARANAERETKRGTSDPTYLIYTLGKLEILRLREEYKKLRGDKFSLQEFHDRFLQQGHIPLKLIRQEMLRDGGSAGTASQSKMAKLVDEFIAAFFRANPTPATLAGIHDYDALVEDYSPAGVEAQILTLRNFERRFEQFVPSGQLETDDRDLALSFIRSNLLRLEELRMWEQNPGTYSNLATNTIFVVMSRNFAPADARLRSVIARERRIPQLLARAQTTIKNPPRVYTETALKTLPGILSFFRNDVPGAFTSVKDATLQAEFHRTNRQVLSSLRRYERFLKQLSPRSRGDFRIGAERFRKKLLYDEMVSTPLDELLALAFKDLRRNQQAFVETAKRIDSKRSPQEVLDEMERDHPAPGQLLDSVRGLLGGLRDYVVQHNIMEVPEGRTLRVEETPPFLRATSFASMDAPGAFETNVNEAFYHVALPDPSATPEQVESHMRSFSYVGLAGTSIHEAYPGHFTQFLWQDRAPSRLRLFLATDFSTLGFGFAWTNVEGWAHYTEQMMLDEGYGNGDPKLRLSQLQDALLRDARFIVGIQMHTGKMTYEEGVEFFKREGYQPEVSAERETRRGTADPTYLVYTLGKLQILELREEYKKLRGANFSLRDFHDRYMREGSVPNSVIRRALLAP